MITINGITPPTAIRLISRCEELVSNEWNLTETYCYQAIYDCDDTIHVPPGGTITYIDSSGEEVTLSGLCDGEIVMIEANAIISTSGVILVDCYEVIPCVSYTVWTTSGTGVGYSYIDCETGYENAGSIGGASGYDSQSFCALDGSVSVGGGVGIIVNGSCL